MRRRWIEDDAIEVGLDEAGRGSLWGRLYVGAVIMSQEDECYSDHGVLLSQIADSKKLTRRRRAVLADYIKENAIESVVTFAEHTEVDALNVLHADMAAMHRALDALVTPFQRVLVDGDYWTPWTPHGTPKGGPADPLTVLTLVDGDAQSLPIAAASILAKEAHDAWVREQVAMNPELDERYGFSTNMGYGTAKHLAGIKTWGVHDFHRRSFAPVRSAIPMFRKSST